MYLVLYSVLYSVVITSMKPLGYDFKDDGILLNNSSHVVNDDGDDT